MLSFIVMRLVDGDGGVDDVRLNRLLVHNRLDVFMNVMMDMFPNNFWVGCGFVALYSRCADGLILELSPFTLKSVLGARGVPMVVCDVLNTSSLVVMLFRQNFLILDRLDSGVMVILVDLAVSGHVSFFSLMFVHSLLLDLWSN